MIKHNLTKYAFSSFLLIFTVSILSGKLHAQQLNTVRLAELHYVQSVNKTFYKANIQTKISVDFTDVNLVQALQEITRKGNLKLTYRGDIIPHKKVSLHQKILLLRKH